MFYYANFSILSSVTLYYVMNFCVVLYLATLYMHSPELCLKSCIKNLTFFLNFFGMGNKKGYCVAKSLNPLIHVLIYKVSKDNAFKYFNLIFI